MIRCCAFRSSHTGNDPLNKVDPLGLRPGEEEFWGDARPATLRFWFPVLDSHKGLGTIELAGFIPEAETSMSPIPHGGGPRIFRGDDRQFTEAGFFINQDKNRFFVRLNFATGDGYVQVNPTCRASSEGWFFGGDCASAFPIQYGGDSTWNISDHSYEKNIVGMQRSGNTLRFKWSVVMSSKGAATDLLRPRADGNIDFTANNDGTGWEVGWHGDCFPSIEVMRVTGDTTSVVGRVSDAGAYAMTGSYSKVANFFGACG